jgi:hypothetical protein
VIQDRTLETENAVYDIAEVMDRQVVPSGFNGLDTQRREDI